jgi:hypothetical protein
MQSPSLAGQRRIKLGQLVQLEGYDSLDKLLAASIGDSVSPAICMNDGCAYTAEMEPDQDRGWCEACGTNTVASALILAGMI